MDFMVLDVETIGHPDAGSWFDAPKPDGRLKDPEKIAVDIAEKIAARTESFSLHPDTCRVIAIGYTIIGQGDPVCLLAKTEDDERTMLRSFWHTYRQCCRQAFRLVTFFGHSFDIPVLLSRSMYLDVEAPDVDIDRYRSPHIDVHWRLSRKGAIKAYGLRFYARRLGLGTLDKVDGGDIAQLVKDNNWEAIEQHCLSDVGLTHALAHRLRDQHGHPLVPLS